MGSRGIGTLSMQGKCGNTVIANGHRYQEEKNEQREGRGQEYIEWRESKQ